MSTTRHTSTRRIVLPAVTLASTAWLVVAIALSPSSQAHAYLDPGTGSYVIQVAIGMVLGGTYAFKRAIGTAVASLKKRFGSEEKK